MALVFSNGRVGRERFAFELESVAVLEVANVLAEEGSVGNVYEILLDGFELAVYQDIIEADCNMGHDGFTLYEQFRTSQSRTAWSLPTILSSTYYDPAMGEDGDVWRIESFQRGVFAHRGHSCSMGRDSASQVSRAAYVFSVRLRSRDRGDDSYPRARGGPAPHLQRAEGDRSPHG